MITELAENEIFVFGSNLAGRHGGGAAYQAWKQFGAEMGVGEGLTGRCYAFPTLDASLGHRSRAELEASRDRLYRAVREHPEQRFLLTRVGCGIAGYPESQMQSLFADPPPNLILPGEWRTPR